MLTAPTVEPFDTRQLLVDDHADLLQLFDDLLDWFRKNDRDEAREAWSS
jgi:hypothetical protein